MLRSARSKVAALLATATALPVVAFAQAATPPANAADLANSVDISGVVPAMFVIFGLLIGVGVALWAGRMITAKFRPRA